MTLTQRSRTRVARRSCISGLIVMVMLIAGVAATAGAQQSKPGIAAVQAGLPDAPDVSAAASNSEAPSTQPQATDHCSIAGTVLDTNDDVVQGAEVVLTSRSGTLKRETQSGANGQFAFSELPAGTYRVAVTGNGMGNFVSPWMTLHPEETRIVSQVVLAVKTVTTDITVNGNSEALKTQLSEEQVHIAEQQRVLRIFPNFYSSYEWDAPPMQPKQKFQLAFRSMMDPMAFVGAAGIAGFEQYSNVFPGYGGGVAGYFKRYGAAYTNDFSARMLSSGAFAILFHQDPRYFYKGTGSMQSRASYAISCAFITRNDDGQWRPNYAHVLGVFTAAALSNLYYPKEDRGLSLTLVNGAVETAGNAGSNLLREFVLKGITSRAGGKP